ncbi:PIGG [Cordylochernes scorpioides]|uniref:PIGG n=1 Tax=Cordylochernes scorpioides TaxID=51811 RepID=A0ABY6L234_9ARAC|nr:PIGG [Cordylochernes scorpioides]
MTPLPEHAARDVEGCCFLPHHAVRDTQPDKKKLRVVFDAATKATNGFSFMADCMRGPNYRTTSLQYYPGAASGCPKTEKFKETECKGDNERPYQLKTVTYGASPAPFMTLSTLIQLAKDDDIYIQKQPRPFVETPMWMIF